MHPLIRGPVKGKTLTIPMFRVAQLVGEALVGARHDIMRTLYGTDISTDVSLLLGGRIGDGRW
mgnify:CR=1 FL=1